MLLLLKNQGTALRSGYAEGRYCFSFEKNVGLLQEGTVFIMKYDAIFKEDLLFLF